MTQISARLARLVEGPKVLYGEHIVPPPYPQRFDDFVGQDMARAQILTAIRSALKRDRPLGHVLLASGIPGIGKTTLARLTAYFMTAGFVELGGTIKDLDAIRALRVMDDGDVLFIDEIHRMYAGGKARADWLLTLLQDGSVQTPGGSYQAPAVTVIAATTDVQRLPETLIDRFPLTPKLDEYTEEQAALIAAGAAMRMGFGDDCPMPVGTNWLAKVARASMNNPRRMINLLSQVRDIAVASDGGNLIGDEYDISQALEWSGLSEDGLTLEARLYLLALSAHGGTASITTIQAAIGEQKLDLTERQLIQQGYISISSRGRSLTTDGAGRAENLRLEAKEGN